MSATSIAGANAGTRTLRVRSDTAPSIHDGLPALESIRVELDSMSQFIAGAVGGAPGRSAGSNRQGRGNSNF